MSFGKLVSTRPMPNGLPATASIRICALASSARERHPINDRATRNVETIRFVIRGMSRFLSYKHGEN